MKPKPQKTYCPRCGRLYTFAEFWNHPCYKSIAHPKTTTPNNTDKKKTTEANK